MFLKEWYLMTGFLSKQGGLGKKTLFLVWLLSATVALPCALFLDVLAGLGWMLYKVRLWRGLRGPLDI